MEALAAWFGLKTIPGVGNHTYKRLLDAFGSPQQVFAAGRDQLLAVEGVTPAIAGAIIRHSPPENVQKNIDICREKGITVVTMTDPAYPRLLRDLPDPPPYLYVLGRLEPDAACISIVGSRNPTGYGKSMARQLARDLAGHGLTVVSGMARGIDTAAHQGALDGGGKTCAVLGSGVASIYPRENRPLSEKIAAGGAVVSELPVFAKPQTYHFPMRNRIISGMSVGTIVVEAARKSGSLITARLAAEQGREVFAVPGSIQSFKSAGTHGLLKQGARLIENAADVLADISHMIAIHPPALPADGTATGGPRTNSSDCLDSDERLVLRTLECYPVHIDEIVRKTGLDPGKTAGVLLRLELKGRVRQEPGKYFLLK
ncbi:MAG: DNA-processing protein DprA [Thermodesulfobacteriota bacterium]